MEWEELDGRSEEREQVDFLDEPVISIHAIVVTKTPQTMRIREVIQGHGITVYLTLEVSTIS